jgi:hypothetical protein
MEALAVAPRRSIGVHRFVVPPDNHANALFTSEMAE